MKDNESKEVRIDRLKALYVQNEPENRVHEEFDMATFNNKKFDCGTSGCYAGELPEIDTNWEWREGTICYKKSTGRTVNTLAKYFNIRVDAAYHLFIAGNQIPKLYGGNSLLRSSSLGQVHRNFEIFIKGVQNGSITSDT